MADKNNNFQLRRGGGKVFNKGMPLGNLTSQFFANVYLNELDQFVKHKLKARYYLRYVDDFVILHNNKTLLNKYKNKINRFLKQNLKIELHPDKSKIMILNKGITFLGFRIFYYHKLIRKSNIRKMQKRFKQFKTMFFNKEISYDEVYESFQGFLAYAMWANTFNLRRTLGNNIEHSFFHQISSIEINRWLKLVK